MKVTLPDGFDYVPELASSGRPLGDPQIGTGTNTLTWSVPNVPFGSTARRSASRRGRAPTSGPPQATETVSSGSVDRLEHGAVHRHRQLHRRTAPSRRPQAITPDQNVEMSALPNRGAVDYYKIPLPAAGTRLQVHLTNLPADYDLALYSPPDDHRPHRRDDRRAAAGRHDRRPVARTSKGGANAQLTPTALQDVPDPGIPVVQVSANRGTDDEDVGMVSPGRRRLRHDRRLRLQRRVEPAAVHAARHDPGASAGSTCAPTALSGGTAGTVPAITSLPANLNTLILVNEKRIGDTYGDGAETTVVTSLTRLAGDAALGVSGAVIPVEGIARPSTPPGTPTRADVDAANAIANTIANEVAAVKAARPSLKYVVFAGGDDQIPFFRIPDLSRIANENGFASAVRPERVLRRAREQRPPDRRPVPRHAADPRERPPALHPRPRRRPARREARPDRRRRQPLRDVERHARAARPAFVSGYDFVTDGSQLVAAAGSRSILGRGDTVAHADRRHVVEVTTSSSARVPRRRPRSTTGTATTTTPALPDGER